MNDPTPTKVLPTSPPTTEAIAPTPTEAIAPTPTEAIAPPPTVPPPSRPPRADRPSRGPMIAFIVIAVLVFVALAVLGGILLSRVNAPVAAPSQSPSTSSTPTPPAPAGTFTAFAAPVTGECHRPGGRQSTGVMVSWATSNSQQVWVGRGSGDAVTSGEQVPLSGNQSSFPTPIPLDCSGTADVFTMTLVGDNGAHVSRTWTVTPTRHGHGDSGGDGNDNG